MDNESLDTAEIIGRRLPGTENDSPKTLFGGALNYRPLFFAALSLVCGIVLSASVIDKNIHSIVVFVLLGLFFLISLVLTFFKRRLFLWVAVFLLLGFVLFDVSYTLDKVEAGVTQDCVLTGRVSRVYKESATIFGEDSDQEYYIYILEDIRIDAAPARGNAYLICTDFYYVGAKVSARGDLDSFNLDPFDTFSMSHYNNNVRHTMIAESVTYVGFQEPEFFTKIHEAIKERYTSIMSAKSAGVALSLILGDKSILSTDVNHYFRAAGLSHIFAVSGLHIGFLVGMVFFICRKTRLGRYIAYSISFAAMLMYGLITGFPPSITRAIVMTSVAFVSFILFRRQDPLNTLSLAAIIILILRPLSVFEVGFQLSFAAVLGIICFYNPLRKRLSFAKNRFVRFVGKSFAISIAANSFLLAVAANAFAAYGVYFCLSNLVVIPIVSLLYALTMFATALSLIIPPLGVLLVPLDYLYMPIVYIAKFFAELPSATSQVNKIGFVGVIYAFALFFMSRFVMVSSKTKYRVLTGLVAFALMYAIVFL